MGAWGYKPYENDGAQDLLSDVMEPAIKRLDKLFRRKRVTPWERWERLGVLSVMLRGEPTLWVHSETCDQALVDIDLLREDTEFIDSWNVARKRGAPAVRRSLTTLARQIKDARR